ncbi:MAG: PEGA domain-containing protein, partial [Polyangiaceae bacterium]
VEFSASASVDVCRRFREEIAALDNRPIGLGLRVIAGAMAGSLVLVQAPRAFAYGTVSAQAPVQAKRAAHTAKSPAAAKPDLAVAKKHYAAGDKLFKAGDFAGALEEFKQANDIKPVPQVERLIGLCEDNLGHLNSATVWYERFLAHVPEKLADQGDEIKKRDAEIKALPGKVHIESSPSGASVTVDGSPRGTPTPTDVDLAPGSHTIELRAPGRTPVTKSVDVAFASSQMVTADLEPAAPSAVAAAPAPAPAPAPVAASPVGSSAPPPPESSHSVAPAIITGALAVAAAGVGTVFGVMTLNDKSDYDKNPTSSTADSGDTHSLVADMSFGLALTFAVTSAVLFFTKDSGSSGSAKAASAEKTALSIRPVPMVSSHSGGAGFVVRF